MKKFKYLVILLLIFALALTLFACNKDGVKNNPNPPSDFDQPKIWDRQEINEKITRGLRNAGNSLQEQTDGVRHVVSKYDMLVDAVNMMFYYEANYNLTRDRDSEILFRIFNYEFEKNELFVYYKEGTLYYEVAGRKYKINGFGNTPEFDTFYRAMKGLDAGDYFFSEDFANLVTSGVPITRNMSVVTYNERQSIMFKDVNLNVAVLPIVTEEGQTTTINLREFINGLIKDYSSLIGESFDALSQYLLGFELSMLKNVEIGVINLDELSVINESEKAASIDIKISGKQADNIGIYRFNLYYSADEKAARIELKKNEDPNYLVDDLNSPGNKKLLNEYKSFKLGQAHYKGTMYIPSLDIGEDNPLAVEIKADISSTDNTHNLLYIDIRNKTENLEGGNYHINKNIALVCYEDGTTYIDLEGLRDLYLGDGIALWQLLNVPGGPSKTDRLAFKFTELNLSSEMGMLSEFFMSLILGADIDNTSIFDLLNRDRLSSLLSFISSDGSKIVFTINDELIARLIGDDSATLVEWIAEKLGVSETIIESVVGTGVLNDIMFKVYFDTVTDELGISLFNGSQIIFKISLYAEEIPEDGIDIDFPLEYFVNKDKYYTIREPEAVVLELSGSITKQGATPEDMSRFMGAFIGDVTGANTPFSMAINDILTLDARIWTVGEQTYVKALLKKGSKGLPIEEYVTVIELYTIVSATLEDGVRAGDVYCTNYIIDPEGIRYTMPLQALVDAFNELLGEDNVFTVDGVMNILNMLSAGGSVTFGEEDVTFRLAPNEKGGVTYDPIYELIGLRSLIADMTAKIRFLSGGSYSAPQDFFGAGFDENAYFTPVIAQLPNVTYTSIYEANWHDNVNVTFGSKVINFKLSFRGDSAKLVSNKYDYYPEAKLFGETVSYMMLLTDTVNGTKVISELAISKLSINPIEETPIPKKISVLYDDGTFGELAFEIVGFPYSDKTIGAALQGLALRNYTIIIGKGSIAQREFLLPIEVLGRVIVPLELKDVNGQTYTHYENVPIVATVTIDPYDYLLKKMANPAYNPVDPRTALYLYFRPLGENLDNTRINVLDDPRYYNFSWGFDENAISYRGGIYYAVADYYSLKIAIQITVKARVFDYIKVFVKDPDHGLIEESNGNYTVDALLPESYNMPATTDNRLEVRIYFQTGNYRVIGSNLGVEINDECDGEFPLSLQWSFIADNINIDGTNAPLLGGTTNINKGLFAAEESQQKRFEQKISLVVNCPSRRLDLLAESIRSETDRDLNNSPVMGDIKINKIAFAFSPVVSDREEDYGRYTYNPIAPATESRLPAYVYIPVQYAGVRMLRRYPVTWLESSLIDRNGNLRYPSADEVYVKAEGRIGPEAAQQIATIAIHNIRAPYKLDIPDPNKPGSPIITEQENGVYILNINPYDNYILPNIIAVKYTQTGVNQTFTNIVWYMQAEGGGLTDISPAYRFPYRGGDFTIYTFIEKDASAGILAQTVTLKVRVESMILNINDEGNYTANGLDVGQGCLADGTGRRYVSIDTYAANSLTLLNMLQGGIDTLTLNFTDGSGNVVSKPGMSVTWNGTSVLDVINALKSPLGSSTMPGGYIELRGSIFQGTNIEQSIAFVYKIDAQEFGDINFANLDPYYTRTAAEITNGDILADPSRYDVLSISVDHINKIITVDLRKPYALKGAERNYALPSEYFSYLLDSVNIIIGSSSGARQIPGVTAVFGIPLDFDRRLLNFSGMSEGQITSADFNIQKLNENSSCEESFVVRVNAHYDVPVQTTIITNVETLEQTGDAKNEYKLVGYPVEPTVSVTYYHSGVIRYAVGQWLLDGQDYIAYKKDPNLGKVVDNENSLRRTAGAVTVIPNALFHSTKGNTIKLMTTLPDGTNIHNEIKFLPKNIGEVDYQATASDSNYSVGVMGVGGTIIIRDAYSIYPFDPGKLPNIIVPNISSIFNTLEGLSIRFTIDRWIPAAEFAEADGTFSPAKLREKINSGGIGEMLLATAEIRTGYPVDICDEDGNLTEVQTIELKIMVASLYQYTLSHPRLSIGIDETEEKDLGDAGVQTITTRYSIVVDPYALDSQDRYSANEGGEMKYFFRLPLELHAVMYYKFSASSTISTISHTFLSGDLIYEVLDKNNVWHHMTALQYSYNGHKMGSDYGASTDPITVRAKLKDYLVTTDGDGNPVTLGQYFEFVITFLDRTLKEDKDGDMLVMVQNYTNRPGVDGLLTAKYYIDPYNEATFTLPDRAIFKFKTNDISELNILWNIPADAPFVTVGTATRFNPAMLSGFYEGGVYSFYSDLSHYGVDPQYYQIDVIVVNRALKNPYGCDNPNGFSFDDIGTLQGMASDIPNTVTEDMFTPLTNPMYADYNKIAIPVVPSIRWQIEDREIDFINGFSDKVVNGNLTYGNVVGESATIKISGSRMVYVGIVAYIDKDGNETPMGENEWTIEFNPYIKSSAAVAFKILFELRNTSGGSNGTKIVTCYSMYFAETDAQKRAVIDWGEIDNYDESAVRIFYITNLYKYQGTPGNRLAVEGFKYSFGQMIIYEIDLGYGRASSGYVEFVIDPLYPQIPNKVTAYSRNTITYNEIEIKDVPAVWDPSIYTYTSLEGGQYDITLTLNINNESWPFTVRVYFLNRVAKNIYTTDPYYSTMGISEGYYRLLTTDPVSGVRTSYFQIDPIRDALYDSSTGKYKLPTNIKVTYNYNYPTGSILQRGLMNLGAETFYEDITWVMSGDIELSGTQGTPLTLRLDAYTFKYQISGSSSQTITVPIPRENNKLDSTYYLSLEVLDRSVAYTSVSETYTNEEGATYQLALQQYEIDPYNPAFPTEVKVYFKDLEYDPKTYTDVEWIYDDEDLNSEDVLSGTNPDVLYIWASIKVFGATLSIKFRIKPRYIDVPRYPNGGVIGIDGGTLYVLKGSDIRESLPKYLYYKFDNAGTIEVARVPLSFSPFELAKIDTSKVGVYTDKIKGRLGKIDDGNIMFNIVVIDPVIYNVIATSSTGGGIAYSNGSFIYDLISVPANQLGEYNAGQEYLLMPRIVVVQDGGYLEIDHTRTVYDIETQTATFYCKYYFRSTSDRLSGNANGYDEDSQKLTLVFTKQIVSYNYNNISEELFFRNESGLPVTTYVMNVPLGQKVYASQMPKAYDSRGNAYDLFWDFSKVNVNRAGDYVATGYYRNQLENNVPMNIVVRVQKQKLNPDDIRIDNYWLERRYSGTPLSLEQYLTVANFLREDGSYGPVSYIIGYAFSENGPWIGTQPVDVGTYYVRILINDYNVDDFMVFTFRIRINEIAENEIYYMDDSPGAQSHYEYDSRGRIIRRTITYTYNGREQRPQLVYTGGGSDIIGNNLLRYAETSYRLDESGQYVPYTGAIKNVGEYKLVITIDNSQPNFYYNPDNLPIEVIVRITRKTVYYSLVDSFVYAGQYVNVPVIIRDAQAQELDREQYSDIYEIVANSVYIYQQRTLMGWEDLPAGSKVLNAGTYRVTVRINGGANYSSANLLLPNGNPDPSTIVDELRDKQFTITKKRVDFRINKVTSLYLEDLLPFYSNITLTEPGGLYDDMPIVKANPAEIAAILGSLNIVVGINGNPSGVNLTKYSVKGVYPLTLTARPAADAIANYEIVNYYDGEYEIATPSEAVLITNAQQLLENIEALEDNSPTPYRWYLSAGNYGNIVIDKNVNLFIVGAYDSQTGVPAVVFDSITILKGTVGLDIVRLQAKAKTAVVSLGSAAGSLTVSRAYFSRPGNDFLTNSVAIQAAMGYKNTIYVNDTYIHGFTSGILMMSGSINMRDSILDNNVSALQVREGDLELQRNTFSYNKSEAIYIGGTQVAYNFNNNSFVANVVAIKTTVAISNEVFNRNNFANNARNLYNL